MNKDVIIACDFDSKFALEEFLKAFELEVNKPFLKIGMELYYAEGPALIRDLKQRGYRIFLDLKLHDIPTTVHKAMKVIDTLGVDMINVHAAGGIKMMQEAKRAFTKSNPLVIAVTQLTSTSTEVMNKELLIPGALLDVVREYANNAKIAGLDGVVCSALEAPVIKELGIYSVTPGIRFKEDAVNDQVRVVTPEDANKLGSSFIVVGRSITASTNPLETYKKCMEEFSC